MSSRDRAALVALFRSTGGVRWIQKHNWDTDADLSRWYGVQVNGDGRVVKLRLAYNNLKGPIPRALGALKDLTQLDLGNNNHTGEKTWLTRARLVGRLFFPTPYLRKDYMFYLTIFLHHNNLFHALNAYAGSIPVWLGSLRKLQQLRLYGNQLQGPIPEALGALTELKKLRLYSNKLTGPIPEALGALKQLTHLSLEYNKLTGSIPRCLGSLSKLQSLHLNDNLLVGAIPAELGNLSALRKFKVGNNPPKSIWRPRRKKLTGGPAKGERLDFWRARIRPTPEMNLPTLKVDHREEEAAVPPTYPSPVLLPQQPQTDEGDEKEEDAQVPTVPTPPVLLPQEQEEGQGDEKQEDVQVPNASTPPVLLPQQEEEVKGDKEKENAPVPLDSPNLAQEAVGERVRSPERASLFADEVEEVYREFRAQLSSSAGLDPLIRENPEALEDIQQVIEAQVTGSLSAGNELSDVQSRRKLGTLVTMSTTLGEVVLRHTEDMNIQRKELALAPFWKAYYTAVRSGLCEAYLAASVIGSDSVATSKTGRVGKAGAALNLMSSAVPVIGGLTGLAGKALQAGDHFLQTRRLMKITALAPDAVECCSLANRLALQLTDGLRNDASATADDTDQVRVDITAGMKGGSGSGRGADMLPGDMSEEDVFEYLLEEVSSYDSNSHGGNRLGKQHLRKLLKGIQRGCLDGSHGIEQKIRVLLLEIVPGAGIGPVAMSSTPKEVIVRSPPVVAPVHDSELPSRAEFAAIQAALEALNFDRETQQAELEELQAAKDTQRAELEAIKFGRERQQEELKAMGSANKMLQRKVKHLEKYAPELDGEPSKDVDFGGGLALRRRVAVTETAEGFLDRARDRAVAAADHHPVTVSEQREFEALQNEKHREHEARLRELEGKIRKAAKGKGRR
ncbi:unnamed protein product [Ectocarpus fasciculatus]